MVCSATTSRRTGGCGSIVGILLIISSFMLLTRSQFARWIGLIVAAIMGLSAITWMPYYPIWALTYVGIAVLVFYGLAAHGGRIRRLGRQAPNRRLLAAALRSAASML